MELNSITSTRWDAQDKWELFPADEFTDFPLLRMRGWNPRDLKYMVRLGGIHGKYDSRGEPLISLNALELYSFSDEIRLELHRAQLELLRQGESAPPEILTIEYLLHKVFRQEVSIQKLRELLT